MTAKQTVKIQAIPIQMKSTMMILMTIIRKTNIIVAVRQVMIIAVHPIIVQVLPAKVDMKCLMRVINHFPIM